MEGMHLYLVRHGKAEAGADDALRRLTPAGRKAVRRVARALQRAGVQVGRIEHSGLVRAAESAEILGEALGGIVQQAPGLEPLAGIEAAVERILAAPVESLMLVGHNPFMESLASYLITGGETSGSLHFRTAAVACFSREGDAWRLEWFVEPDLFPNHGGH